MPVRETYRLLCAKSHLKQRAELYRKLIVSPSFRYHTLSIIQCERSLVIQHISIKRETWRIPQGFWLTTAVQQSGLSCIEEHVPENLCKLNSTAVAVMAVSPCSFLLLVNWGFVIKTACVREQENESANCFAKRSLVLHLRASSLVHLLGPE